MSRKQYRESFDDTRWTSLRLFIEETTGKIRIAESRKDMYPKGGHQRTCYTSDITFPTTMSVTALPLYESGTLPADPILLLQRSDDHPHYFPSLPQLPQDVHPDNNDLLPIISKIPVRYYSTSAMTFLDLVNLTTESRQSLRLRAQSRQPHNPSVYPPNHEKAGLLSPQSFSLLIAIKETYRECIKEWPNLEGDSDTILRLLNPPTHLGDVTGTADERSIVYLTGSDANNTPHAIVFISFDPAIKLLGLERWKGVYRKNSGGFDRMASTKRSWPNRQTADAAEPNWIWREQPMYTDIDLGVYLGC
jgi:hypothetical protein